MGWRMLVPCFSTLVISVALFWCRRNYASDKRFRDGLGVICAVIVGCPLRRWSVGVRTDKAKTGRT